MRFCASFIGLCIKFSNIHYYGKGNSASKYYLFHIPIDHHWQRVVVVVGVNLRSALIQYKIPYVVKFGRSNRLEYVAKAQGSMLF